MIPTAKPLISVGVFFFRRASAGAALALPAALPFAGRLAFARLPGLCRLRGLRGLGALRAAGRCLRLHRISLPRLPAASMRAATRHAAHCLPCRSTSSPPSGSALMPLTVPWCWKRLRAPSGLGGCLFLVEALDLAAPCCSRCPSIPVRLKYGRARGALRQRRPFGGPPLRAGRRSPRRNYLYHSIVAAEFPTHQPAG